MNRNELIVALNRLGVDFNPYESIEGLRARYQVAMEHGTEELEDDALVYVVFKRDLYEGNPLRLKYSAKITGRGGSEVDAKYKVTYGEIKHYLNIGSCRIVDVLPDYVPEAKPVRRPRKQVTEAVSELPTID